MSSQMNKLMNKRIIRLFTAGLLGIGVTAFAVNLSPSDQQMANKLSQANNEEISMGRMVVEKAKNPSRQGVRATHGQRSYDPRKSAQAVG